MLWINKYWRTHKSVDVINLLLGMCRNRRVKYLRELGAAFAVLGVLNLKSFIHRTDGTPTVARKSSCLL